MKRHSELSSLARHYVSLLMLLLGMGAANAQTSEELTQDGRDALGKGDYTKALEYFDVARAQQPDDALDSKLTFYAAVTQQQAATEAEPEQKTTMLKNAAELYEAYLDGRQDSAAWNNLAKVYEELGSPELAAECYRKAIATGDAKAALYQRNYAELLDSTGEREEASAVYLAMVREQPLSTRQQSEIGERFAEIGLDPYVGFLWALADTGSTRYAADKAIQTLLSERDAQTRLRNELLTIVSVSLARELLRPGSAWDESFRNNLKEFAWSGDGNRGAQQLLTLQDTASVIQTIVGRGYRTEADRTALQNARSKLDPAEYSWWQYEGRPDRDPPRGVWPSDGLRYLIRSHGDGLKQAARSTAEGSLPANTIYELAEEFYRLSANLQDWEVDPLAIRELVRLKIATDDLPGVRQVLDEYEFKLYEGKGDAIRNRQLAKTFEFHKTLGEIYTQLSVWGDSSSVQSAVFQLEHAHEKSLQIEERAGGKVPEAYQFTPEMVDMLDQAYQAEGQPEAGVQLRLNEARRYEAQGDETAVKKVLRPVESSSLPEEFQKYRIDQDEVTIRRDLKETDVNQVQPTIRQ